MTAPSDRRRQESRRRASCQVCWILIASMVASGCGGRDPYSVSALSESLKNSDAGTRYTAAEVLGQYGSAAKSAMPALIESLRDSDAQVRARAAYSIANIGPDGLAVPDLIASLSDDQREV